MYRLLGLHFSFWLWILWPLRFLMRISTKPQEFSVRTFQEFVRGRHTIFVIPRMSLLDIFVLNRVLKRAGLPIIKTEAFANCHKESSLLAMRPPSGIIFMNSLSDSFSEHISEIIKSDERVQNNDIVLYPVSVFWSRTPSKTERNVLLRMFFTDDGRANVFQKIGIMLLHSRNIHVHFGRPIRIADEMATQGAIRAEEDLSKNDSTESIEKSLPPLGDAAFSITPIQGDSPELPAEKRQAKKLRRYLLIDFRRERTAALGPMLYEFNTIANIVIDNPETRSFLESSNQNLRKSQKSAVEYLREMAADYNYATVRAFEIVLDFVWTRIFKGVRVRNFEAAGKVARGAQVLWMPCHRSHIDYLLLSYVLLKKGLVVPHIAAGLNLSFWPVGSVLRQSGAFFLRRSFSGNRIYAHIFAKYVDFLMHNSFPVEFFHEGGRSRIGKLLSPKRGMLSICVASILRRKAENTLIIPVFFGYEKVLEDDSYASELLGAKKQKESVWQLLSTLPKLFSNYGRVDVSFAEPLNIGAVWREYIASNPQSNKENPLPNSIEKLPDSIDSRNESVQEFVRFLARRVNQNINSAATAAGSSLLAAVLLAQTEPIAQRSQVVERLKLLHWIISVLKRDLGWNIATSMGNNTESDDFMFSISAPDNKTPDHEESEPRVELRPFISHGTSDAVIQEIIQNGEKWEFIKSPRRRSTPDQPMILRNPNKEMNLWWYRGTIFHVLAVPGLIASLILDVTAEARTIQTIERKLAIIRRIWDDELYWPTSTQSSQLCKAGLNILTELQIITISNEGHIDFTSDEQRLEIFYFLADLVRPERELYSLQLSVASSRSNRQPFFKRDELLRDTFTAHRSAFLRGVAMLPANLSRVFGSRTFEALLRAGVIIKKDEGYRISEEEIKEISDFFELSVWNEFETT